MKMMAMKGKKYEIAELSDGERVVWDMETNEHFNFKSAVDCLNQQQATITELEEETEVLLENLFERQEDFRKSEKEYHERIMNYQTEIKGLENIIFNLKNEIHNLKNDNDYYTDKRRFDLYD